jgi:hypothetical protein
MIGGLSSIAASTYGGMQSGSGARQSSGNTSSPGTGSTTDVRNERYGWESDRRLKQNIIHIGKSKNGFNIYNFEYKDKKFGEGVYQGVMSDEVPNEAVIVGSDGYDRVNYSLLDVEFKKIK